MRRLFFITIVAASLSACSSAESEAQEAVRAALKDPDSARFGEFKIVEGTDGKAACLVVNAKNSMGGYTGNQMALVDKNDQGAWEVGTISEMDFDTCEAIQKPDDTSVDAALNS